MYTNEEQLRAAYALNLCTVSVSQIIAYNDIGVLEQEYENILNNLNLERIPKDDALREVYNQILDTIKLCRISEGDKKQIDLVYQHKVKNAVWSAVPRLGMIFATHDLTAMALTLASQVGIGYMNYRRNKADYQLGREQEYWQLERNKLEMFGQLEGELFNTAWNLADAYDYPDEYRLTSEQLTEYNKALMEDNPIRRYGKLDGMSAQFAAYPHFWYQMGSTANSIYHDSNMPEEIKNKYKNAAISCFEQYRKLNKFNLLRHDAISSAWALEYVELLDLDNSEEDRKKAVELLREAESHAGDKNKDVFELCACAYLKLGNLNETARLLRKLVNWDYNVEVNVQILSAIYLHIISPNNPESTDNDRLKASGEYNELRFITQPQYILPKPSTEEEWAKWEPTWDVISQQESAHESNADSTDIQTVDSPVPDTSEKAEDISSIINRAFQDETVSYKRASDFSEGELKKILCQMAYAGQESFEDIIAIYDPNAWHCLNEKYGGILFMQNGFYYKEKDNSNPQYMSYSSIISVEEKFSTEVVHGVKGQIIKLKGIRFAQPNITSLFEEIAQQNRPSI